MAECFSDKEVAPGSNPGCPTCKAELVLLACIQAMLSVGPKGTGELAFYGALV